MAKLHELIAVRGNLDSQDQKVRNEMLDTFNKRRHIFEEKRLTFTPFRAEDGQDPKPVTEEQSEIQATISGELQDLTTIISKALDVRYQIEVGNSGARADVVVEDGHTVLIKDAPATALLTLSHHLQELRNLAAAIPTLDPAKGFRLDTSRGHYVAREVVKVRTKKTQRPLVLHEATKEHPAQVQLVTEDIPVGSLLSQEWSGLITPKQKSDILARIDKAIRAVSAARSKANEVEVDVHNHKMGKKLLDYIFEPAMATSSGPAKAQA